MFCYYICLHGLWLRRYRSDVRRFAPSSFWNKYILGNALAFPAFQIIRQLSTDVHFGSSEIPSFELWGGGGIPVIATHTTRSGGDRKKWYIGNAGLLGIPNFRKSDPPSYGPWVGGGEKVYWMGLIKAVHSARHFAKRVGKVKARPLPRFPRISVFTVGEPPKPTELNSTERSVFQVGK